MTQRGIAAFLYHMHDAVNVLHAFLMIELTISHLSFTGHFIGLTRAITISVCVFLSGK